MEYADGSSSEISDGAAGTVFRSVIVRGKTSVNEGTASGISPTKIQTLCSGDETTYPLPDGITLYSTPNDQYYDTYDAASGILTRNCAVFAMSDGFIYGYSQSADTIVWITDPLFRPSKLYYLVKNGAVTSGTTDWQGKIQIVIPKTDAGITSTDTSAQACAKMIAYWGGAYAILPSKSPETEQYTPTEITVPEGTFTLSADYGSISASYCKDADKAHLDIIAVQLDLEGRIAQLEINSGGGKTVE